MKKIIFTILLITPLILTGCFVKKPAETITNTNTDTSTNIEVDTSDWQTYRNEQYGFELKIPEDWKTSDIDGVLSIYNPDAKWPDQQAGVIKIFKTDKSVEKFIEDYNLSDVSNGKALAEIISRKNYSYDGVNGIMLVGTTAQGTENNYFLVQKYNSYYLVFSTINGNNYHVEILQSLIVF